MMNTIYTTGGNMSNQNEIALRKKTGAVQVRPETLTPEQQETYQRVINIVDRNPILDWKHPDHNTDFCIIEKKLEPVKNFHLKAQFLAGLSISNDGETIHGDGEDSMIISRVTVWKEGENRRVTMAGASTVEECGGKGYKHKAGKNSRAFHDAVARSQTRAMKNALEAYMGFPFINMILQELFGGYEITPGDEGATTEDQEIKQRKKAVNAAWKKVKDAVARGIFTEADKAKYQELLQNSKDDMTEILKVKQEIDQDVEAKRG